MLLYKKEWTVPFTEKEPVLLFVVLQFREKIFLSLAEEQTAIRKKWSYNFVHPSKAVILLFLLDCLTDPFHQPTQNADDEHSEGWIQAYLPTPAPAQTWFLKGQHLLYSYKEHLREVQSKLFNTLLYTPVHLFLNIKMMF